MAEYQEVFLRRENKYLIDRGQRDKLLSQFQDIMEEDEYFHSIISSVYFDTPDFRLIRASMEKPVYKEKLRVRCYGKPENSSEAFIEIKKKFRGTVGKRRVSVTPETAYRYMSYEMEIDEKTQIQREIDWFRSFYGKLVPTMFISCERDSYLCKADRLLRITFDSNILYRDADFRFAGGIYGQPLLDNDHFLMEVKTLNAIPLWLSEALCGVKAENSSFSKYGNAYTNTILENKKREEVFCA